METGGKAPRGPSSSRLRGPRCAASPRDRSPFPTARWPAGARGLSAGEGESPAARSHPPLVEGLPPVMAAERRGGSRRDAGVRGGGGGAFGRGERRRQGRPLQGALAAPYMRLSVPGEPAGQWVLERPAPSEPLEKAGKQPGRELPPAPPFWRCWGAVRSLGASLRPRHLLGLDPSLSESRSCLTA